MKTTNGFVSLVGGGPGDPDLLTVKAARRLGQADELLHDALIDPACCSWQPAPDDASSEGGSDRATTRRRSTASWSNSRPMVRTSCA